jgi:hypothetical protein
MSHSYTDQQLQAYLDESLAPERMAAVERDLRKDARLREHLIRVAGTREAGVHGIGEIWRRHRISCPSRQQMGGFLLGAIDDQLAEYISFHVDTIECRICKANLEDLRQRQSETQSEVQSRRRRYFQTSAGYLKGAKRDA